MFAPSFSYLGKRPSCVFSRCGVMRPLRSSTPSARPGESSSPTAATTASGPTAEGTEKNNHRSVLSLLFSFLFSFLYFHWPLITRRGVTKREGEHVKFCNYEK